MAARTVQRGRRVTGRRTRPMLSRAKLIQLIHVGAGKLGLIDTSLPASDPERTALYRAFIAETTEGRCDSCADCSDIQLDHLLARLIEQGFKIEPAARHGRRPRNMECGDMRSKVEALLTDMELPWGYAESILQRMRGFSKSIACPIVTATAIELRALIAALSTEQKKRDLLQRIDTVLHAQGWSRTDLVTALRLRNGWERRIVDLEQAATVCAHMSVGHG